MSEELSGARPRCKFLTCKSMMVYGEDFEQDPEYQMGLADRGAFVPGTGRPGEILAALSISRTLVRREGERTETARSSPTRTSPRMRS